MNYICATKGGQESADKIDFYGLRFADCGAITCKYMNFMLNLLIWVRDCYARKLYE